MFERSLEHLSSPPAVDPVPHPYAEPAARLLPCATARCAAGERGVAAGRHYLSETK
ncbi:hypothetical protein Lokhon_01590 [Limimaricola hongkongensis DSM 17492]|uniref:Uncharacterized protein n=1 Tax=Limimaricola hongkongensis DSM 17492 TaxID=1122180 RepID=A0A017HEP3_9RHOB|nr:hypothetical protein Lokhon_01590 [Limimaricola hongkongensis DSM 17492]